MQWTVNSKFVNCRNGELSLAFVWNNRASFWFYCLVRRHRCGRTVHPANITAACWAQSSRNHPAAWNWLIWVDCESASAVLKTREHAEPNISGAVMTCWSSWSHLWTEPQSLHSKQRLQDWWDVETRCSLRELMNMEWGFNQEGNLNGVNETGSAQQEHKSKHYRHIPEISSSTGRQWWASSSRVGKLRKHSFKVLLKQLSMRQ